MVRYHEGESYLAHVLMGVSTLVLYCLYSCYRLLEQFIGTLPTFIRVSSASVNYICAPIFNEAVTEQLSVVLNIISTIYIASYCDLTPLQCSNKWFICNLSFV